MIIDRVETAMRYANVHAGFREAFEFIVKAHTRPPAPGRHEIIDDRVYALISESTGHGPDEYRLEAHRRYHRHPVHSARHRDLRLEAIAGVFR